MSPFLNGRRPDQIAKSTTVVSSSGPCETTTISTSLKMEQLDESEMGNPVPNLYHKTSKLVIGLSGKKGCGKDTVFGFMREMYPESVRLAFADCLKEEVYDLLACGKGLKELTVLAPDCTPESCGAKNIEAPPANVPLDQKVAWVNANKDELRVLLQRYGTEYRRRLFGDNYWTVKMHEKIESLPDMTLVVITDVRFFNEAAFVRRLGGMVGRIERPWTGFRTLKFFIQKFLGFTNGSDHHPSETELDNYCFDFTILNNSGLSELRYWVKRTLHYTIRCGTLALLIGMFAGCTSFEKVLGKARNASSTNQIALQEESRALTTGALDALSFAPTNTPTDLAKTFLRKDQQIEGIPKVRIEVEPLITKDPVALEALGARLGYQDRLISERIDLEAKLQAAEGKLIELGKLYEAEKKKSIIKRIWAWSLVTLGTGGMIVVLSLCPPLIPIVIGLAGRVLAALVSFVPKISGFIGVVGKQSFDAVVGGVQDIKTAVKVAKAQDPDKKYSHDEVLTLISTGLANKVSDHDDIILSRKKVISA